MATPVAEGSWSSRRSSPARPCLPTICIHGHIAHTVHTCAHAYGHTYAHIDIHVALHTCTHLHIMHTGSFHSTCRRGMAPMVTSPSHAPGQEQPSPVHGLLVCGCSQPGLSTASFSLVQGPLKPHLRLVGTRCTAGPASPKPGPASSDEQSEGLGVIRMSWQALGNAPLKIRTWEVLAYLHLLPGVSQPGWRSWGMF